MISVHMLLNGSEQFYATIIISYNVIFDYERREGESLKRNFVELRNNRRDFEKDENVIF